MRRVVLLSCLILTGSLSYSQTCQEKLIKAENLYERGSMAEAKKLILDCSHSERTSDKEQTFRLLSLIELYNNHMDSAKYYATKMLNINPTYKSNALTDPAAFTRLLESIIVIPKFTLGFGISAGINQSVLRVSKSFVIGNYNKTYTPLRGTQFGVNLGFNLNPHWVFNSGLMASTHRYRIDYQPDGWDVSYKETLTYLDVPITMQYCINPKSKIRFSARAGAYVGFMIYGQNSLRSAEQAQETLVYSLDNLQSTSRRNTFNYGATTGASMEWKKNKVIWGVHFDYFHSLRQITWSNARYCRPEYMYTYFYLDDDIILHNFGLRFSLASTLSYKVYDKKSKKKHKKG